MMDYYGKIDLRNLPPSHLIDMWERQARGITYVGDKNLERVRMDYVWECIANWQENRRGEDETKI